MIRFAIAAGMRRGEILALEWRNIDISQRLAKLHDTQNSEARQMLLSTSAIAPITPLPRHIGEGPVFLTWHRGIVFRLRRSVLLNWLGYPTCVLMTYTTKP